MIVYGKTQIVLYHRRNIMHLYDLEKNAKIWTRYCIGKVECRRRMSAAFVTV